jgi:predicted TIM-barrel fold metal-dependent hydrolase
VTVDSLAFLGDSLFGPRASAAQLLESLDSLDVARAVVAPFRPRGYHLGPANDALAQAVRSHPDRLRGLVRVDPNLGEEAAVEAERGLGELGLVGVFLHPWEETFRINGGGGVDAVLEVARRRGAPVVIAAGYPWLSEGLQIGDVCRRFPDVTVVATNGGQLNISGLGQTDVELALAACPNLHLGTAGVYREDFLENVVARFGAERLLFSSHFPLYDPRLEVLRGGWMHVDESARDAVQGRNAARIFGP